jgi:superfamily II DNA or RNA helicase
MFVARKQPFKAVVVVHKEFLAEQWKENIEKLIPEAKIGMIQQDKIDTDGKDIVIAMLQSICLKEYPDEVFSQFDFAVFDECHHLAARVFSKALLRIGSRYLLGLSATPTRKDGCHNIFFYNLGSIMYQIKRQEEDKVFIKKLIITSNNTEFCSEVRNDRTGNRNTIQMINNICSFPDRNQLIVDTMRILLREQGRKIILLSARRDDKHLGLIRDLLEAQPIHRWDGEVATMGFYMGRRGENKKK